MLTVPLKAVCPNSLALPGSSDSDVVPKNQNPHTLQCFQTSRHPRSQRGKRDAISRKRSRLRVRETQVLLNAVCAEWEDSSRSQSAQGGQVLWEKQSSTDLCNLVSALRL